MPSIQTVPGLDWGPSNSYNQPWTVIHEWKYNEQAGADKQWVLWTDGIQVKILHTNETFSILSSLQRVS